MTSLTDLTAHTPGLPCRTTDPELFHSNYARDRRRAALLCDPCPIRLACQTYAVENGEQWGVWGGLDFTAVETHCGTERGHQIHVRNRETACRPCAEAHRVHVEERRREQLSEEHAKGGTVRGYEIHRRMGEAPCASCKAASGRASAERRARQQQGRRRLSAVPGPSQAGERLSGPQAAVQRLALAG
ncbi:WhiB family transcriptional regulator [Streptomyces pseudovenezuelae]|uniref:WhiB family transcriptional regulator n=1 Tax=Streptomyces pseudovenezuelae TaxID=67350 RepID=UPI0036E4B925